MKFIQFYYEIYKKHVYVAAYVILMAANDCCANKTFGCSNV